MDTPELTISGALRFGWERFRAYPWVLLGVLAVALGVSILTSLILEPVLKSDASVFVKGVLQLGDFIVQTFIGMGLTVIALKAHDAVAEIELKDLWQPHPFFKYLFGVLLVSIIVGIGFILLIVPGLIAMVMLVFVPYLVMDRQLGPIDAIKESIRITRGFRFKLFFLVIILALLNLAGALLFGIGLLVTVPVSMLAMAYTFRTLEKRADTDEGDTHSSEESAEEVVEESTEQETSERTA